MSSNLRFSLSRAELGYYNESLGFIIVDIWLSRFSYKNNIFFFSFLQQHQLSSKIFSYLCEVVDDDKDVYDKKIYDISKLIILEGK